MDKKSGMSGFHGKRVLFIRTLGLLIALSLLTVVIFGVFINQLVVKNLQHLQRRARAKDW